MEEARQLGYPVMEIVVDKSATCAKTKKYDMNIINDVELSPTWSNYIDEEAELPLKEKINSLTPEQVTQAQCSIKKIETAMGKTWTKAKDNKYFVDPQLAIAGGDVFICDIDKIVSNPSTEEDKNVAQEGWDQLEEQRKAIRRYLPQNNSNYCL